MELSVTDVVSAIKKSARAHARFLGVRKAARLPYGGPCNDCASCRINPQHWTSQCLRARAIEWANVARSEQTHDLFDITRRAAYECVSTSSCLFALSVRFVGDEEVEAAIRLHHRAEIGLLS